MPAVKLSIASKRHHKGCPHSSTLNKQPLQPADLCMHNAVVLKINLPPTVWPQQKTIAPKAVHCGPNHCPAAVAQEGCAYPPICALGGHLLWVTAEFHWGIWQSSGWWPTGHSLKSLVAAIMDSMASPAPNPCMLPLPQSFLQALWVSSAFLTQLRWSRASDLGCADSSRKNNHPRHSSRASRSCVWLKCRNQTDLKWYLS